MFQAVIEIASINAYLLIIKIDNIDFINSFTDPNQSLGSIKMFFVTFINL